MHLKCRLWNSDHFGEISMCQFVVAYGTCIWVNNGSGNGLLHEGTKPWTYVDLLIMWLCVIHLRLISQRMAKLLFCILRNCVSKITSTISRANEVRNSYSRHSPYCTRLIAVSTILELVNIVSLFVRKSNRIFVCVLSSQNLEILLSHTFLASLYGQPISNVIAAYW